MIYTKKKINFDYVYECSGLAINIEHGFKLLKNNGVCIFSSHPKFKDKISFNPHEFIKGKKIEGSWGGQINFKKELPEKLKNSFSEDEKYLLKIRDIDKDRNEFLFRYRNNFLVKRITDFIWN